MQALRSIGIASLNHLISAESWAQERLRQTAGARLTIEIPELLQLGLAINEHGFFIPSEGDSTPDVSLVLTKDVLVKALFQPDRIFSSVRVLGSADVAENLAFVLRNLSWDAEGDMARVFGDVVARRVSMWGRSLAEGLRQGGRKFTENVREYAVEESKLLAAPEDLDQFNFAVSSLRDDVARLEKRLSKL